MQPCATRNEDVCIQFSLQLLGHDPRLNYLETRTEKQKFCHALRSANSSHK
jgi:hypothetical protein